MIYHDEVLYGDYDVLKALLEIMSEKEKEEELMNEVALLATMHLTS